MLEHQLVAAADADPDFERYPAMLMDALVHGGRS
jgi:hypothetical protein